LFSLPFEIIDKFMFYPIGFIFIGLFYEFFFIMAGFFLLYSLLWKRFGEKFSSLFNGPIIIFYLLALIMSLLYFFWAGYGLMFFSQIIVFSFAAGIAFEKYGQSEKKGGFLRLYLVVILLMLLARIIHFFVYSSFKWNIWGIIAVYFLEIVIFLLFLYEVVGVTKR